MTKKLISLDDAPAAGSRLPAAVKTEILTFATGGSGIGPVTVTGTPTAGQVPTAVTATTATWQAGGGGGDPAAATHAATAKTTPVDADEVPLVDSAATFGLKRLTWANLKAGIKSYYDSVASTLTNKTISGASNTLTNIPNGAVTGLGPLATLTPTGTPSATTYLSGTGVYSTPASGGGGLVPPIQFSSPTAVIGGTVTDEAQQNRTLTGAKMRVASAPAGSALTVQVQHSATSGASWANVGSALSIAAGSTTAVSVTFSQAQTATQLVRLNITSVGSTTPAGGFVVDVFRSAA